MVKTLEEVTQRLQKLEATMQDLSRAETKRYKPSLAWPDCYFLQGVYRLQYKRPLILQAINTL